MVIGGQGSMMRGSGAIGSTGAAPRHAAAVRGLGSDRYQAQFSGNQVAIDWVHVADLTAINGTALPMASGFRVTTSGRAVHGRKS